VDPSPRSSLASLPSQKDQNQIGGEIDEGGLINIKSIIFERSLYIVAIN
jgi:hypothetical protein